MGAELPVEAHCVRGERKGRRRAKNTICSEVCVCLCVEIYISSSICVLIPRAMNVSLNIGALV